MEYGINMFLNDSGSLNERLCRLMTGFDETVAVTPRKSERVISRYEMWLTHVGDSETSDEYTAGMRRTCETFRLFLRHRALTSADLFEAEEILNGYVSRIADSLAQTESYRVESGSVKKNETDSSVWDFFVEFKVLYFVSTPWEGVRYYIAFGGGAPTLISIGCRMFKAKTNGELYKRRYFDAFDTYTDVLGDVSEFDFEFDTGIGRCALSPILTGADRAFLYELASSGEAKAVEALLSEKSISNGICKGKLISCGSWETGSYDTDTGTFIPDKKVKGEGINE